MFRAVASLCAWAKFFLWRTKAKEMIAELVGEVVLKLYLLIQLTTSQDTMKTAQELIFGSG